MIHESEGIALLMRCFCLSAKAVYLSNTEKIVLKKNWVFFCVGEYMGLINKGRYGVFFAYGIWCLADVSSVSPSSEQTGRKIN